MSTGVGLLGRFAKFNGAFSQEQLDWLDSLLSLADARGERVTLVCEWKHFVPDLCPLLATLKIWQQCIFKRESKVYCSLKSYSAFVVFVLPMAIQSGLTISNHIYLCQRKVGTFLLPVLTKLYYKGHVPHASKKKKNTSGNKDAVPSFNTLQIFGHLQVALIFVHFSFLFPLVSFAWVRKEIEMR